MERRTNVFDNRYKISGVILKDSDNRSLHSGKQCKFKRYFRLFTGVVNNSTKYLHVLLRPDNPDDLIYELREVYDKNNENIQVAIIGDAAEEFYEHIKNGRIKEGDMVEIVGNAEQVEGYDASTAIKYIGQYIAVKKRGKYDIRVQATGSRQSS